MASAVAGAKAIPEPLTLYRQHTGQQIGVEKLTLRMQLRHALDRMDRGYFAALAGDFDVLADRLEALRPRLRDPGVVGVVREKAALCRRQAGMRDRGRVGRALLAGGELARGRYHRLSHGWKAFAVDLLL